MKKQVLFMIDNLACGGAERSLVSLLPCLDYNKINVDLLLVGAGGIFEKYVPKQVNILYFNHGCTSLAQRLRLAWGRVKFSISLRLNRFRRIQLNPPHMEWVTCGRAYRPLKKEYDVAIAYQQGFPCYYVMDKVAAKRKIAWINVDIYKTRHQPYFIKPYYNRYDKVVTVSDAMFEKFISQDLIPKNKLICIYDILNTDFIQSQSLENLSQICDTSKKVIVTVARLIIRNKGQDLIVKAAKIIKDKGLDFKWILVGDGPDYLMLSKQIEEAGLNDYVILAGLQSNPYPFIRRADLYVQTSRYEGFGLTITEAKILRKPIVTTNFPSAYNQIIDGENGLIVEMTPEAISDAIFKILNNQDLAKQMIEANRRYKNTTSVTESRKVMSLILEN